MAPLVGCQRESLSQQIHQLQQIITSLTQNQQATDQKMSDWFSGRASMHMQLFSMPAVSPTVDSNYTNNAPTASNDVLNSQYGNEAPPVGTSSAMTGAPSSSGSSTPSSLNHGTSSPRLIDFHMSHHCYTIPLVWKE